MYWYRYLVAVNEETLVPSGEILILTECGKPSKQHKLFNTVYTQRHITSTQLHLHATEYKICGPLQSNQETNMHKSLVLSFIILQHIISKSNPALNH